MTQARMARAYTGVILGFSLILVTCSRMPADGVPEEIVFLLDWKAGMEYAGFFFAEEKGYYANEGLVVRIQDGSGATTTARLVGNGTHQIGLATGDAVVIGAEKGLPLKSAAVIFQRSPVVVFSLREAGIRTFEDLYGKTVGVSRSDTKYNYYRGLLNRLGVPSEAINEVSVGFEVAPLLTGDVDALLGYINVQPLQVSMQGKDVSIIPFSDYGLDVYSEAIIVNASFLAARPDIVERFVRASLRGWREAIDNPEEAVRIFHADHPHFSEEYLRRSFAAVTPLVAPHDGPELGSQTREGWERAVTVLLEYDLIEGAVDVDELYWKNSPATISR